MSDQDERTKRDFPEEIVTRAKTLHGARAMRLSELFPGDKYAVIRESIRLTGKYHSETNGRTVHVATRQVPGEEDPQVMAIAAVARDPGRTQDYIDTIQDFTSTTEANRASKIKQYWEIYKTEGVVNNAINKYAALLSSGGRVKVRRARKGKKQSALEELQAALDYWVRYVNGPTDLGVATAARGLKALTEQGIRVALVEGDWMGRQVWANHKVGSFGSFALPMTIQTLSMEFMESVTELGGLGELWYWRPAQDFLQLVRGQKKDLPKEAKDIVKRLVEGDVLKQLRREPRALLTPALLSHVKHRGSDRDIYGESFIEPAKMGIRYLRAVSATDMVSMENVINRLMVIMVGTTDPTSPYSDVDVAASRAALMQSFFEDPGPNMTIVWQGDDVKIEAKGAMENVLDLEKSHQIGEHKIKVALGIPEALLTGTTSDGKSAGWASVIAASGMAEGLGARFAVEWTILAERIALENGYTDVELVFEFDRSNIADRVEERNQVRQDYTVGLIPIYDYLLALGKDPDATYRRKCFEKGLVPRESEDDTAGATWEEAFMPPQGLAGQADGEIQGDNGTGGTGRTPNNVQGKPTEAPKEKPSTTENK